VLPQVVAPIPFLLDEANHLLYHIQINDNHQLIKMQQGGRSVSLVN